MKFLSKNHFFTFSLLILAFVFSPILNAAENNTALSPQAESATSVLNKAFYYYNNFDYDNAIIYFEKYNKLAGDEEVSLLHLGKIYLNLKQFDKARNYFERILKVNPKSTEALSYLADIYLNAKNLNEAIKALKSIVELEPVDERALFTLAEIYREQKNARMSMVYYKKLSIATIKNSSNFRLLNKAYTQIARYYYDIQDYEKALEYYKKIVEVNPEDFNSTYIYAELLKVNGKFSDSAIVMQQLLQKDSTNQSLLESIVESMFITDDFQTRAYLTTYLENNPHPDAIYLGIDKILNNDPDAARTYFQTVLKRNPNRLSAHIGLFKTIDPKNSEELKNEAYVVTVLAQKIRAYPVALRYMHRVFEILDADKKKLSASGADAEKLTNELIDTYYTHAITLENLGNARQAVAYYLESLDNLNNLISSVKKQALQKHKPSGLEKKT